MNDYATSTRPFLSALYEDIQPGYLSLFLIPGERTIWIKTQALASIEGIIKAHRHASNIYFGIGIHPDRPTKGRGVKEHVSAIPAIWVDIDIASPVHKAKNLPPSVQDAQALLSAVPLLPSVIVHSGHGLQAYWLLKEPWMLGKENERRYAEWMVKSTQGAIQAEGKTHGWHVDSTFDLARVFRVPGTMNYKPEDPHPRPCTILAADYDCRYNPSDFEAFLPAYIPTEEHPGKEVVSRSVALPLYQLRISSRLKYLLRCGEDPEDPRRYATRSEAVFAVLQGLIRADHTTQEITDTLLSADYVLTEKPRERGEAWLRQEIGRAKEKSQQKPSHVTQQKGTEKEEFVPQLQTMTELLEEDLPSLHFVIDNFLHEGLWIFGGKSKRGKSWLMLDLAMAITAGRAALNHFPTNAAPVLYLALEDGKRRVKHRALKIEPMIQKRDLLHIAYKFPRLQEGAVKHLRSLIDQYHFKLVIIDVLAKLATATGKNTDMYMQVYDELSALHDLCEEKRLAIILLDHLRKQQADDIFDEIQGSVAKQGVADALMVLDRKPDSDDALLHIRSKEIEDTTHAIQFYQHSFRYIGEGEAHKLAKERYEILSILIEQQSPMGLPEMLKAMALENNSANYQRIRRTLLTLENEDFVKRLSNRGNLQYLATIRAKAEGMPADYDDVVPF